MSIPAMLADNGFAERLAALLSLRDHNTQVVIAGTTLLGLAAGVVGVYMLLRRRSLIGDALSHATLPGLGLAFIVMVALGGTGKSLPGLLAGAVIFGLIATGAALAINAFSRIKPDAALGIVLSVFFGLGVAIMGIVQRMPTGNQAGLESFIYGKTASMLTSDAQAIGATALLVLVTCVVLYKEFAILSFDPDFGRAQGWPVFGLDVTMMLLVTAVTVIGLQAVGLILIIALLITPAAAARFWTNRLPWMLAVSGGIGAISGCVGSGLSAVVPRLPAGAIIVLVAAGFFGISMLIGVRHGLVLRIVQASRLRRRVARQHLLRAMYEWLDREPDGIARTVPRAALLRARSWSPRRLGRCLRSARSDGLITATRDGARLTDSGRREAARVARNHRLWEIYLITHADIAPSHVDRDADQIEHVLDPTMIRSLEAKLAGTETRDVPASPHVLTNGGDA